MKYLISGILLCVIVNFSLGEPKFKKAKIELNITEIINKASPLIKIVDLGTDLTSNETHYEHEEDASLYMLVFTDPDISRRGRYNWEFHHWIVGNISEAKGKVLAEYVGPAPPKNTGKHRYVFLVYKQNQGAITFDERRLNTWDESQLKLFYSLFYSLLAMETSLNFWLIRNLLTRNKELYNHVYMPFLVYILWLHYYVKEYITYNL